MKTSFLTPEQLLNDPLPPYEPFAILAAAIQMGVFDDITAKHPQAILNALTSFGFLKHNKNVYSLSTFSKRFLKKENPGYLGDAIIAEHLRMASLSIDALTKNKQPILFDEELNAKRSALHTFRNQKAAERLCKNIRHLKKLSIENVVDIGFHGSVWSAPFAKLSNKCHITLIQNPISASMALPQNIGLIFLSEIASRMGDDLPAFLNSVHKSLTSNGYVVIIDSFTERRTNAIAPALAAIHHSVNTPSAVVHSFSDYIRFSKAAGFSSIKRMEIGMGERVLILKK